MKYYISRSVRTNTEPWKRRNPIIEIWNGDGTHHKTDFDLRISPHDGLFHDMDGGRSAAVFDSRTGEKNGPVVAVRGLFRFRAAQRASKLLEEDDRGRPRMRHRVERY